MKKIILNPISIIYIGLFVGMMAKYFDLHTEILGNLFSQLPIWILIGVLIAVYSENEIEAMVHVLLFCLSMLNSYYVCAKMWNPIYGIEYIKGWSILALCTPLFSYFAWISKEKGIFPKLISIFICMISLLSCVFIYPMTVANLIVNLILTYFMLLVEVERK